MIGHNDNAPTRILISHKVDLFDGEIKVIAGMDNQKLAKSSPIVVTSFTERSLLVAFATTTTLAL
jgi:hypothetical protein